MTARASNSIEASSSISPAARAVWVIVLFLIWGAALGSVYQRMIRDEVAVAATSAAQRTDRRRHICFDRPWNGSATLPPAQSNVSMPFAHSYADQVVLLDEGRRYASRWSFSIERSDRARKMTCCWD